MVADDPGGSVHQGRVPYEAYAAWPAWRWSHIKLLEHESPRAVRHAVGQPSETTAAQHVLQAIHCAVLEPDALTGRYSVYPHGVRRGARYQDWLRAWPGRHPLSPSEWDRVRRVGHAVRAHPVAAELLAEGEPEVSLLWPDEETGIPCKARLDWLGPMGVVDLKTLGTVHEQRVASMVARQLYHAQLAHYVEGCRVVLGYEPRAWLIVAEGHGAHDVAVFEVDAGIPDGALHVGRQIRRRLMRQLLTCLETGHWPGRHAASVSLALPLYALEDPADGLIFGDDSQED